MVILLRSIMETFEIQTIGTLKAEVAVPSSKSYTNRALIVAALADGVSRIENPLFSDDTHYMSAALRAFGIAVEKGDDFFSVQGGAGRFKTPKEEIFVGNAGTAMRFLTTFSALVPGEIFLTGDERMQQRPIGDLLAALRSMGINANAIKGNQCPPVAILGGGVRGGTIDIAGDQSSQYLTSLMLCAPYFQNNTRIKIVGDLTSRSYVDITLDIMRTFGATVENDRWREFEISSGQSYNSRNYRVEGDASSASYFLAAGAIAGGEISVTGLNPESVQGDMRFSDALERMGCRVEKSKRKITIYRSELNGININMNTMPDTAQTLAVTALFAKGETTITGISNLRIKETNRISALESELSRLGAEVRAGKDFIRIKPAKNYRSAEIETYNDHRMAMSFALAGLKIPGVKIKNPKCVEKSFPGFFDLFQSVYE
tara:strand:- start:86 stop:1378 length:1293 start_codon:yes stop_codon:yes gene_type:complete